MEIYSRRIHFQILLNFFPHCGVTRCVYVPKFRLTKQKVNGVRRKKGSTTSCSESVVKQTSVQLKRVLRAVSSDFDYFDLNPRVNIQQFQ